MNDADKSDAAASRALALALQAWPDESLMLAVLNDADVEMRTLLMQSLALNMFFVSKTNNPQAIYDVLLRDDPLHQAQVVVSERQRAVNWLSEQLGTGPKYLNDLKRANADAQWPLAWKSVTNAAQHIGVRRGRRVDEDSIWSLPPSKSASKPQSR